MKAPARIGWGESDRQVVDPSKPLDKVRAALPSIQAAARGLRKLQRQEERGFRWTQARIYAVDAERLEHFCDWLDVGAPCGT